jgi:hypothetical protein
VKSWSRRLKVLGAAALLASLFLPISTCGRLVTADGKSIAWQDPPPEGARVVIQYDYALEHFSVENLSDGDDIRLLLVWRRQRAPGEITTVDVPMPLAKANLRSSA